MVIITAPGYDPEVPPRSIFDPPDVSDDEELSDDFGNTTMASSHADTLTTRETISTGARTGHTRRRHRKHPSQLNEVELRVQLWDAYRLARIILGTPIKSSSLKGKTILQSIRKVAEMKLELIRMEKELEMAKVFRDQELSTTAAASNTSKRRSSKTSKTYKRQSSNQSSEATVRTASNLRLNNSKQASTTSLYDELNMQIANLMVPEHQEYNTLPVEDESQPKVDQTLWQTTRPNKQSDIIQESAIKSKLKRYNTTELSGQRTVIEKSKIKYQNDGSHEERDDDNGKQKDGQEDGVHTTVGNTKTLPTEQMLDLYKTRYESLQTTHFEMLREFQNKLSQMQAQLDASTASSSANEATISHARTSREQPQPQQPRGTSSSDSADDDTIYTTSPGEPSGAETGHFPTLSSTPRARSSPKNKAATNSTSEASKPSQQSGTYSKPRSPSQKKSRADVAFNAVVSVARDHDLDQRTPEERQLRTEIAKATQSVRSHSKRHPSSQKSSSSAADVNQAGSSGERKKLQTMIQQLMKRVEESSEETRAQFESLQEQLRAHQNGGSQVGKGVDDLLHELKSPETSYDESSNQDTVSTSPSNVVISSSTREEFERRLKTAKTLHTLELETFKNRHTQQVVDLSGQLDSYQQQVEIQNTQLQKWRRKYHHLEEMAVSPDEAHNVLQELETLSPHASPEAREGVQAKAVQVLQRMAQLQSHQQKEQKNMAKMRQSARAREAETREQLDDLMLQYELLQEDTKVSPDQWKQQLSQQRKVFEKEMKDIYRREEKRMMVMEKLEAQLTELAFVAVEVEDLEVDFKVNEEVYAEELTKARRQLGTTAPVLQDLQVRVKQALTCQRKAIQNLEHSWTLGTELEDGKSRLSDLRFRRKGGTNDAPKAAEDHHDRLQKTLAASQQSVHRLEETTRELRSDSTASTAQLSE